MTKAKSHIAFWLAAFIAGTNFAQAADNAQPVNVEADQMEVRQSENIAIFTGNVDALRGDTRMKSARMVVHYAKAASDGSAASATTSAFSGSSVTRIIGQGGVTIETPGQIITGDKANLDVKTNILIVTGEQVVVTEGESVIKGNKLIADLTAKTSRMEGGRVSGSFVPGKKK